MFKDRDVICFLGDSLTANGRWMAEVYQTLRKKIQVKCYNCGIAGGNATTALGYLHRECLIYNPDYVVIAFGINDIERHRYSVEYADSEVSDEVKKASAINKCLDSIERLACEVTASGAKPILCIPAPYDDKSVSEVENLNCQSALDRLGEGLLKLSQKYGYTLVDFKKVLYPLCGTNDLYSPDRVHPLPKGQHIMAQTFMYELGEINDIDITSEFVFEDWNKKRFDIEQSIHLANMVEFITFSDVETYAEKKAEATRRYNEIEDKTDFWARVFSQYLETIDKRRKIIGEIVKHTIY